MRQVITVNYHRTACRPIQTADNISERGLAGPGRASYRSEFSRIYNEAHIIECMQCLIAQPVRFGEISQFNKCCHSDARCLICISISNVRSKCNGHTTCYRAAPYVTLEGWKSRRLRTHDWRMR